MADEREIEKTENVLQPNALFDESSNFIIYPTLLGIKVCQFGRKYRFNYGLGVHRYQICLQDWYWIKGCKDHSLIHFLDVIKSNKAAETLSFYR